MRKEIINCKGFIIPNSPALNYTKADGSYASTVFHKEELTDNIGLFFQMWLHNDESDNILRHYKYPVEQENINYEHLKGKKEGDVVVLTEIYQDRNDPNSEPVLYEMHVILSCLDHRYRSFGSFEDCISRLLVQANWSMDLKHTYEYEVGTPTEGRRIYEDKELIDLWATLSDRPGRDLNQFFLHFGGTWDFWTNFDKDKSSKVLNELGYTAEIQLNEMNTDYTILISTLQRENKLKDYIKHILVA